MSFEGLILFGRKRTANPSPLPAYDHKIRPVSPKSELERWIDYSVVAFHARVSFS